MTQKISLPLWVIIVFLVTVITGSWVLVMPKMKEAAKIEQDLIVLNKDNNSQVSSGILTVDEQKKIIINSLLPDNDNQLDLSIQVEGLAKQLGLSLNSLNSNLGSSQSGGTSTKDLGATSAVPSGLKAVTFSVSFNASYYQAQDFIKGLYTINRLVRVDSVIFNGGENGLLVTQVNATAFYAPSTNSTGQPATKSGTNTTSTSKVE